MQTPGIQVPDIHSTLLQIENLQIELEVIQSFDILL